MVRAYIYSNKERGEIKFCINDHHEVVRVMPKWLHTVLQMGQCYFLWIYSIKLLQNALKMKFMKILEYTFSELLLLALLLLICVGL